MLARLRPRSAYDVMAALSLFIVLGGTSYAVATGSIDSREVKNNSLQGGDVRNGSLASKDVKRDSLGTAAIKESALGKVPNAAIADRAGFTNNAAKATTSDSAATAATAGNAGNLGGIPASRHLRDIRAVTGTGPTDSNNKTRRAFCAPDEEIVGGGGYISGAPVAHANVVLRNSFPEQGGGLLFEDDHYVVEAVETDADAGNWSLTAYALCAKGS